jgi:ribosome-binding factor A
MPSRLHFIAGLVVALLQLVPNAAFSHRQMVLRKNNELATTTSLFALYSKGRSASRNGKEKSKRQHRVGQLVTTELARIIHTGLIKGDVDFIDHELRQRISIVSVDVAPDLRQARISVSIRKSDEENSNPVVDKRRAYSWLVENTKPLRHTLAQRMSHMKTSPDLTFVQVDVGAAVDVMYLIDKVTSGFARERIGHYGGDDDNVPRGFIADQDFDEEFDKEEWDEEDDEFFGSK